MGQKHSGSLDITSGQGTYRPKHQDLEDEVAKTETTRLDTPAFPADIQTGDSGYEGDRDKQKSSESEEEYEGKGSERKRKRSFKKEKGEEFSIELGKTETKKADAGKNKGKKKFDKKDKSTDGKDKKEKKKKSAEKSKKEQKAKDVKQKPKKKGKKGSRISDGSESEGGFKSESIEIASVNYGISILENSPQVAEKKIEAENRPKKENAKKEKKEKDKKDKVMKTKTKEKKPKKEVKSNRENESEISFEASHSGDENKPKKKNETSCCGKKKKKARDGDESKVKESKPEKKMKASQKKKSKSESNNPVVANEEFEIMNPYYDVRMEQQSPNKKRSTRKKKPKPSKDPKSSDDQSSPEIARNVEIRSSLHREKKITKKAKLGAKNEESFERSHAVHEEAIIRTEAKVRKPEFQFDEFGSFSSRSTGCDSECEGDCQLHLDAKKRAAKRPNKRSGKRAVTVSKSGGPEQFREYLCHVEDMNDGELRELTLKRGGKKIMLVRDNGHYYALSPLCPNDNARLADGVLHAGRVRCGQDGASYDIRTGRLEDFPGLGHLHRFQVDVESSHVTVHGETRDLSTLSPVPPLVTHSPDVDRTRVLILGDGPGAVKCAETLREEGFRGEITLACSNPAGPFDPAKLPSLISSHKVDTCLLRGAEFFQARDINVISDKKVFQIDPDKRHVTFVDGHCTKYDFLVLAPPRRPRKLSVEGAPEAREIHYWGTPQEAVSVAKEAKSRHVVILGGSLRAVELASQLQGKARSVDVVTDGRIVVPELGDRVSRHISEMLSAHHVSVHTETTVLRFSSQKGRLHQVELSSGERLLADVCVVTDGLETAGIFTSCGLTMTSDGYIATDEETRTSRSGVFALGSTARTTVRYSASHVTLSADLVKMEYAHGHTAALTILSRTHDVNYVPFHSTHIYNNLLSWAGLTDDHDDVIIHDLNVGGTPGKRPKIPNVKFVAYYVRSGRVVCVLGVNCGLVVAQAAELFSVGRTISHDEIRRSALSWTHKLHHSYNATNAAF